MARQLTRARTCDGVGALDGAGTKGDAPSGESGTKGDAPSGESGTKGDGASGCAARETLEGSLSRQDMQADCGALTHGAKTLARATTTMEPATGTEGACRCCDNCGSEILIDIDHAGLHRIHDCRFRVVACHMNSAHSLPHSGDRVLVELPA